MAWKNLKGSLKTHDVGIKLLMTKAKNLENWLARVRNPDVKSTIEEVLQVVVGVTGSRSEVAKAANELVTINGRPFTLIEDSGFKKLLEPILKGFNDKFSINSQNIRNQISPAAQRVRQEITNIVKNRLLSLKMDCVTRHDALF
ncbi:hypothetical protein QTP88_029171 [Uroleucon formosanum]